jgi:AcrR family transcriptional regulator
MAPPSTRERILDAAEELFARHGIADTSLRALTRHAGVNLAAVHYHFGSKDGLLDAVVERIAAPINADRRERLARLEDCGDGAPSAADVLLAFFLPVIERLEASAASGGPPALARLIARVESEPPGEIARLSCRHFGEIGSLYTEALVRALPELAPGVVAERFHLAHAVFTAAFQSEPTPARSSTPAPREADRLVARAHEALAFAIAGLCAPATRPATPCRPRLASGAPASAEPDGPRLEVTAR